MRTPIHLFGVFIALSFSISACDSQMVAKQAETAAPPAREAAADESTSADPSPQSSGGEAPATPSTGHSKPDRMIIHAADLRLETDDPSDASRKVEGLIGARDGYVEEAITEQSRAEMTLRVPAGGFDGTLERIRTIGRVVHEKVTGRDVTRQYRDLEAKIANKEALESRLRSMLRGSSNLDAALKAEKELARVRTDIQRLENRRKGMKHDVAMSTVQLTFVTPESSGATSFGDDIAAALGDAAENFGAVCTGLIRLAGGALPLVLLLTAGVLAVVAVAKSDRFGGASE